MATVTGYTAARMKQIEDSAIIDGDVVGNDLILTPKGFATTPATYPKINAGNVRGPIGPQGIPGEVTDAELAAAISAAVPAGTMVMFAGETAPIGYLLCDGSAVDRTTYATLFAVLGTKYGIGDGTTTFNLPDMRNRFAAGKGPESWSDTVGKKGGFKDGAIISHSHIGAVHTHTTPNHQHLVAAHAHGMNHGHTGSSDAQGTHSHSSGYETWSYRYGIQFNGALGTNIVQVQHQPGSGYFVLVTNTVEMSAVPELNAGSHAHNIGVSYLNANTALNSAVWTEPNQGGGSTGNGGSLATEVVGVAAADRNLNPYVTVNYIVKI